MEIHIRLRIEGGGFPSAAELRLRHELEDWIQEKGLGKVVDAGAGCGVMDIYIEPRDDGALGEIERLVAERGLSQLASVRAVE